jgi:RES domain-containing protein
VRLWRIATETRDYKANDLSGGGAAEHPGRWNAKGEYVIYASPSISLAVLETAAHIDAGGLPLNRFLIAIDIPLKDWDNREELDVNSMDPAWCAIPAGRASVDIGSAWYQAGKSPILLAPSAIVQEERIVIINAKHPAASAIKATTVRPFSFGTVYRG